MDPDWRHVYEQRVRQTDISCLEDGSRLLVGSTYSPFTSMCTNGRPAQAHGFRLGLPAGFRCPERVSFRRWQRGSNRDTLSMAPVLGGSPCINTHPARQRVCSDIIGSSSEGYSPKFRSRVTARCWRSETMIKLLQPHDDAESEFTIPRDLRISLPTEWQYDCHQRRGLRPIDPMYGG